VVEEAPRIVDNVLYYTLSTIAQALAGTLAILVAVAVASSTRVINAIQGGEANPRYQEAKQLNSRLKQAVGLSLTVIGLCFVALPFTRMVAAGGYVADAVLTVVVVLGLVCLFLYWRLISTLATFF